MPEVKAENVTKKFSKGKFVAVDNVSLEIKDKEYFALLGPSGCGKTTLLRLISGLENPDSGSIIIDGEEISCNGYHLPPFTGKIGFVFQASSLWPHMTVRQNIMFGLSGYPKKVAREKIEEVISLVSLKALENRYPDQLSGGQARRVALARSIVPRPKYLLLDEPLINLDIESRVKIAEVLVKYIADGTSAIVYITHDSPETALFPAICYNMENGKLYKRVT